MGTTPEAFKRLFFCKPTQWLGRTVVGVTFVCLGTALSGRFYWEPQLTVGTFVNSEIRSPRTIEVVDVEATRQAKVKVRQQTPPVYRINQEANDRAKQHLEELLLDGDRIRNVAGSMPYLSPNVLSYGVQLYLRSCSESTWQRLQKQIGEVAKQPRSTQEILTLTLLADTDISTRAVAELQSRQLALSDRDYQNLLQQIARARSKYRNALDQLARGSEVYRAHLLKLRDLDWQLDKNSIREALEDLLDGGLVSGLPEEVKQYRITNQKSLPAQPERRSLSVGLLNAVLIPNLEPDYVETEKQAAKLAEEVKSKVVMLHAGSVIVKAGQQITDREFAFLDQLGLTQRRPNLARIVLVFGSVAIAMLLFAQIYQRWSLLLHIKLKVRDLAGIGTVCSGAALACVLIGPNGVAFFPVAAIGFILGSFYGSRLATFTTLLAAGLIAIGAEVGLVAYVPVLVGAIVASILTNRPPTRSHLAMTGVVVAIAQAGLYAVSVLFLGNVPLALLPASALQYLAGGLISAIVGLGAIPYLEQLCYALTPIRLAELANLDRPLLRRLVTEAPGTFQHTLFVANLAEAGARELGADTALVRTGTLYHDVGKTIRPEYFIENQMGQVNPHDVLNDPWYSAAIIKEHVTGGLKLAQKFRVPELLQAFIPEHQGTIVISYFYHQAKARSPEVMEAEFRYDGPIPQSRETGIVMLADACEAALRSLGVDTTLEEAQCMVMRIFQSRWNDGQLKDSGLTLQDLDRLAPVFIQIWKERNHGRIKYPPLAQQLDPSGSSLPEKSARNRDSIVQGQV